MNEQLRQQIQLIVRHIKEIRAELKILKTKQGDFSRSAKSVTISSDAFAADHHDHFMLQPQSGTSDDLSTITGASDGRRITLYPQDSGDTITVRNNVGNILLGSDRVLDAQSDTIVLIYSAALGKWLEEAYHDTAGVSSDTEAAQDAVGLAFSTTATITPTYNDAAPSFSWNVNPASISAAMLVDGAALAEILDDDGAGSGLDADLLDGVQGAGYSLAGHSHAAGDATTLDGIDSAGFLILAGQAGGQSANGGTAANEDLTLRGTAHATKTSSIIFLQPDGGDVVIGGATALARLTVLTGGIYLSQATDDFAAIKMRPNDGNKTSRIQVLGDSGVVHSEILFNQIAPTGAGSPTDSQIAFRTMDAGSLVTRMWLMDTGVLKLGGQTASSIQFGDSSTEAGPYQITVLASGGATPASKGTGYGRDFIITAGASDNTAGRAGGDLYLRGGVPTSPATEYGLVILSDQGGYTRIGQGTDASVFGTLTKLLVTGTGTAGISARDSTNDVEAFLMASSGLVAYVGTATNHGLRFQTNNTDRGAIDTSGNFGFGTLSPQGRVHGHDGLGNFLFVTKTAVAGTAVTIVPNGTGDITRAIRVDWVLRTSGGTVDTGTNEIANGADTTLFTSGSDSFNFRVNADGSADVRRTGGTLTYDFTMFGIWQ